VHSLLDLIDWLKRGVAIFDSTAKNISELCKELEELLLDQEVVTEDEAKNVIKTMQLHHHHTTEQKKENIARMKRDEDLHRCGCDVLVGAVDFLKKPIAVFIRLDEPRALGELTTEGHFPIKFIFMCIGPRSMDAAAAPSHNLSDKDAGYAKLLYKENQDTAYIAKMLSDDTNTIDEAEVILCVRPPAEQVSPLQLDSMNKPGEYNYHEAGRAFSSLISNKGFLDICSEAESKLFLSEAIHRFMAKSDIIPQWHHMRFGTEGPAADSDSEDDLEQDADTPMGLQAPPSPVLITRRDSEVRIGFQPRSRSRQGSPSVSRETSSNDLTKLGVGKVGVEVGTTLTALDNTEAKAEAKLANPTPAKASQRARYESEATADWGACSPAGDLESQI